jgi:hypothetical protein
MPLEIGDAIALGGILIPAAVIAARLEWSRLNAKTQSSISELQDMCGLLIRHTARRDEAFREDLEDYAYPIYQKYVAGVPRVNGSRSPQKRGGR